MREKECAYPQLNYSCTLQISHPKISVNFLIYYSRPMMGFRSMRKIRRRCWRFACWMCWSKVMRSGLEKQYNVKFSIELK